EWRTADPFLFTVLHLRVLWPIRAAFAPSEKVLASYLSRLRALRRRCFERWMQTLQTGRAVVNLPHFVKTYAGRVVEGMAAGRPVISWEIPDRPRNRALFENGSEVLLFAKDDPSQLVDQIRRVLNDDTLSRKLIVNARRKLRRFHTLEFRVQQILEWLDHDRTPCYTD